MNRLAAAALVAALALTGCAGGSKTSTTAPAQGSDPNEIEKADPKTWYAQNCPAKAMKYEKSSGLYLGQGAVGYSAEMLESKPRLWRYDEVTQVATPISMVDSGFTFCYRWDAERVSVKYQGEKHGIVPVLSPDHPKAAGYYVDAPTSSYQGSGWTYDLDKGGTDIVLRQELTPITDAVKASPEVGGTYAPGDGPG